MAPDGLLLLLTLTLTAAADAPAPGVAPSPPSPTSLDVLKSVIHANVLQPTAQAPAKSIQDFLTAAPPKSDEDTSDTETSASSEKPTRRKRDLMAQWEQISVQHRRIPFDFRADIPRRPRAVEAKPQDKHEETSIGGAVISVSHDPGIATTLRTLHDGSQIVLKHDTLVPQPIKRSGKTILSRGRRETVKTKEVNETSASEPSAKSDKFGMDEVESGLHIYGTLEGQVVRLKGYIKGDLSAAASAYVPTILTGGGGAGSFYGGAKGGSFGGAASAGEVGFYGSAARRSASGLRAGAQYADAAAHAGGARRDGGAYGRAAGNAVGHDVARGWRGNAAFDNRGQSGAFTGARGGHRQGRNNAGFRNTYHKDESANSSTFFDDFNDEGGHNAFDARGAAYGGGAAEGQRGAVQDAAFQRNAAGVAGGFDAGSLYKDLRGHQGQYADSHDYDDRSAGQYARQGGRRNAGGGGYWSKGAAGGGGHYNGGVGHYGGGVGHYSGGIGTYGVAGAAPVGAVAPASYGSAYGPSSIITSNGLYTPALYPYSEADSLPPANADLGPPPAALGPPSTDIGPPVELGSPAVGLGPPSAALSAGAPAGSSVPSVYHRFSQTSYRTTSGTPSGSPEVQGYASVENFGTGSAAGLPRGTAFAGQASNTVRLYLRPVMYSELT